jgi:hypothetical protein
VALLGSGLAGVLLALSQGPTWGWASGRTLGLALPAAGIAVPTGPQAAPAV